ncbi:hypothetical protein J6590_037620 [Homalodisca vitripennis]|nr:hypothetical protein J6590_037620 [Homalodisca vitripennis]
MTLSQRDDVTTRALPRYGRVGPGRAVLAQLARAPRQQRPGAASRQTEGTFCLLGVSCRDRQLNEDTVVKRWRREYTRLGAAGKDDLATAKRRDVVVTSRAGLPRRALPLPPDCVTATPARVRHSAFGSPSLPSACISYSIASVLPHAVFIYRTVNVAKFRIHITCAGHWPRTRH